jgi:hypothetical protein
MGVLHGQFEITKPIMRDQEEVGVTKLNAGIGVVIPMRDIIATLQKPSLVEDRDREFEKHRAQASEGEKPGQ